jgi:acyl-CoA thioesterase
MTDLERARTVFMTTTFATEQAGCVIDDVADGYAKCSMVLTEQHKNSLGVPMGGAVFTLADFAFGVASNFDRDIFVSSSADIHFMAPAKGKVLFAEAKQVRCGRRTCLFAVTVTDDVGTDVAYVTIAGSMVRQRTKKSDAQTSKG